MLLYAPGRDEDNIESRCTGSDGGKAKRPEPSDVPSVHERKARVNQHSSEGRNRQCENLGVERLMPGCSDDRRDQFLLHLTCS